MLLAFFIVGVCINLGRGRTPDCHCFGQLYSEPIGWRTLVRNGVLGTIAGFIVWEGWGNPGPSAVAWAGTLTLTQQMLLAGVVFVSAFLLFAAWLLFHILRQQGRLLLRIDALPALRAHSSTRSMPVVSVVRWYRRTSVGSANCGRLPFSEELAEGLPGPCSLCESRTSIV